MVHYDEENIINVGAGEDLTIQELTELIRTVTGYGGVSHSILEPDGTPRKLPGYFSIAGTRMACAHSSPSRTPRHL